MAMSRLGLGRHVAAAPPRMVIALDLAPGDNLQVDRGRRYERLVSVARHDGSRTIDCLFASGRRGTFAYDADVAIGPD